MHPDARQWLDKAARSLVFRPFAPKGPTHDQHRQAAVPVVMGRVARGAQAVLSYPYPERFAGADSGFAELANRSFVYDDALALVWASERGDVVLAQGLAQTLAALQLPDGAWGFSFAVFGDGFYNAGYVRAGTVAWAVYGLARYQKLSGDRQFVGTLERGLLWLVGQTGADGLVRAGRGRWVDGKVFDPDYDARFAATEHQIDAWFAYSAAMAADPELAAQLGLAKAKTQLATALDSHLWRPSEERYAQGKDGDKIDENSALDAAGSWAALLDAARDRPGRAQSALHWVQREHTIVAHGWPGLRPYLPDPPQTWFVEGSLAVALAWWRLGERQTAIEAFAPAVQLACAAGVPLVYAPDWHTDFPLSPAAAPTLGFLLVGGELYDHKPSVWAEAAP